MKKTFILALSLLFLALSNAFAQNEKGEAFWIMLQQYNSTPDKKLCAKTIDFLNAGVHNDEIFFLRFRAFYVPLFETNEMVKAEFDKKRSKIENAEMADLFEEMLSMSSTLVYETALPTPDVNEMLCYSYFATGDGKYIDQLLERAKDNEERKDLDKFMVGANALWWLAEIKVINESAKKYLETKAGNKYAETALKSRSYDLKNIQLDVLGAQKKKGIWK